MSVYKIGVVVGVDLGYQVRYFRIVGIFGYYFFEGFYSKCQVCQCLVIVMDKGIFVIEVLLLEQRVEQG